ncbi:GGDEF domain-containing protein [Hyphococcus sp.]|jgi:diguanylate cyclase|uniref:GGDEF domain-containing protein n=1 Tax=Hyphococcus sp. TaxID=2038636 RepID=UPI003D10EC50
MKTATDISQKALSRLSAWNLDPTPEAYAVLYAHYDGANAELSETIETRFSDETPPSAKQLERLYARFFSPEPSHTQKLDKLANALVNQSSGLQGLAHALSSSAHTFGVEVQTQAGDAIGVSTSGGDVQDIVGRLLELTKKTVEQNKVLEGKLDAAVENIGELHDTLKRAEESAQTDFLTKLANRRKLDTFLTRLMEDAMLEKQAFSIIVGDIDFFKVFNDTYGHKVGDQVLALVASIIKGNIKGKDLAARYGGEEFVIALPNTTLMQAAEVAEDIRAEIANRPLALRKSNKEIGNVTISFGVAEWFLGQSMEALFESADAALYEAKRAGRNRVVRAANHLREIA